MKPGPNILWVVTTQWRAQATGYAGDPNARTPAIDALAAEAVNFTQAVTPHPFGPFARAALLTGVPSPENGVRDYYDPLPMGARTIAHEMAERGYATGFFGKWHLWKRDEAAALVGDAHARIVVPREARGGFEFWEGFESGFLLNDPWLHGTRLEAPVMFPGYQSEVVCVRAGEWIGSREAAGRRANGAGQGVKESGAKPWFCVVSLEAPHPPYDAPANGISQMAPGEIALSANVPRIQNVEAKARRELAGYYAHIEATDAAIGGLLAKLKEQAGAGGWDDLLVVFTSVHGDMHGAHGLFRKGWPHEEAVRVPLLVKLPAKAGRSNKTSVGRRRMDAVSLVDLPALISAYVDRGRLVVSRREEVKISMPSVVALPHQCDRVWRGVRTATRKLVLNADGTPWLFFDLESDPGEMTNLVGDPDRSEEIGRLAKSV